MSPTSYQTAPPRGGDQPGYHGPPAPPSVGGTHGSPLALAQCYPVGARRRGGTGLAARTGARAGVRTGGGLLQLLDDPLQRIDVVLVLAQIALREVRLDLLGQAVRRIDERLDLRRDGRRRR